MKRILLISDSHGEQARVRRIRRMHASMDVCIHLGDIGFDPKRLRGFYIVQGNHDPASYGLMQQQILELEGCRILLLHGHQLEMEAVAAMQGRADEEGLCGLSPTDRDRRCPPCKGLRLSALFHGHTHMRLDQEVEGAHPQPGILFFNREEALASCACVDLDNGQSLSVSHAAPPHN
ncbi:MAG: metallophosphoesterase family protein [Merdibacter sp.]